MVLQDITITGSINSYPTLSYGQKTYIASTDEQSFPIETITGSYAGVWPDFKLKSLNSTDSASNTTVGLVVNVTQSWSGSNITPLGIVPYVHNTMEEFINGEFSGSNYVVSNGDLNENNSFLQVNTTPVLYSIFPFPSASYGALLSRFSTPYPGQMFIGFDNPTGTKVRGRYAKIARIDSLGNDNTYSLQSLTQFRYTDSNAGEIVFDVLNISEYSTYYFYEITSNLTTNLNYDDNRLNFSLSSSYTGSLPIGGAFYTGILSSSYGSWTVYNNPLNNFSTKNGVYNFNNTPNFEIKYTSSIIIKPTTSTNFQYAIIERNNISNQISVLNSSTLTTYASPGPHTITLSGSSRTFTNNIDIIPLYYSDKIIPVTASFFVTQSATIENSTSSFIIEPYLTEAFPYSDYNVLLNNYNENDYSRFYREVLYDDGGTTPSNLEQIVSGTAQFAEINDYLYNASANVLPRYSGVRTTSPGFNLPSMNGFSNEYLANVVKSSSLTLINPNEPNVERTSTYFAYFTSIQANWPILLKTISPVLKYLIKEDGKILTPGLDDITYYNLQGSFEVGSRAYANTLNDTTSTLVTPQTILLSGQSYIPVLYTISGSTPNNAIWSSIIDFENLQGGTLAGTDNFDFYARQDGSNWWITSGTAVNWFDGNYIQGSTVIDYDDTPGYDSSYPLPSGNSKVYEFQGFPQNFVDIEISAQFALKNPTRNSWATLRLTLYAYNSVSLTTTELVTDDETAYENDVKTLKISALNYKPNAGDVIYATILDYGSKDIYISPSYFKISTRGRIIPSADSTINDMWTTGSVNDYIITSSAELGNALKGNFKQIDIPSSGFKPIEVPCEIFPKDEIRFEYDESLTYRVLGVTNTTSSINTSVTYVTLDKPIPPSGINLNHFLVRRKIKDSITGIALDTDLLFPINEGFLLPEYPSSTIKRDLSKIINDLSEKNII